MLSTTQLAQYNEQGYLVFEQLIQGDKLAHYLAVFEELVERGRHLSAECAHWTLELDEERRPIPGMLHKVQGVCVVEPRVLELAREPLIVDRIECLLGPDIDVFGTKFFPKLPGGGTSTHWHQDNFYFGTTSDRIVSCGIYLQDTDAGNGCLRVVPGSHKSGRLVEHKRNPRMHGSWTQVDEAQGVDLPLGGGSVVFFSANLLHGTGDNHSERPRYSTAWHYIPGELDLERFPRGGYEDRHRVRGA